jgi:signal transduction histidine kinase
LAPTTDYKHQYAAERSDNSSSNAITEVLHGAENAVGKGVQFMKNVQNKMDICFDHRAPSIVTELPAYRNGYIDIRNRGGKIRCFTDITKNNLGYCKELLKLVDELRHLEGMKGGIAVSDTEYMATTVLEEAKPLTEVIYSNVKEVVEQAQYVFDFLWKKAIPAEDRIREIEEGMEPEIIETIRDPEVAQELAYKLVKSAKKQILVIFSTANAFHRQDRSGSIQLLREAATRGVDVRILTPVDDRIKLIAERERGSFQLKTQQKAPQQKTLDIRNIELSSLQTKISLLIVDNAFSLAVELKDDTKESSIEALGLASYSNSKATVLSYASFFEALWLLTESYRQIKVNEQMQKEFINTAAHELRTPIQPIIGFTDIMRQKGNQLDSEQRNQFLDVIARNANRLYKLTEDMLDVTRIESRTLKLHTQKINLKELVFEIVHDFFTFNEMQQFKSLGDGRTILQQETGDNNVKLPLTSEMLLFDCEENEDIYVMADKSRLTQVICNLLTNAIEFATKTEERGTISISIKKEHKSDNDRVENDLCAIFCVKDTGIGIDPDILPRLFSKFATKSKKGTGLGLFISKSIIEAHGGRIWAENNKDGKGATFKFALPCGH